MPDEVFVTAINCMDGRTQRPVFEWMQSTYNAHHVDMITEPGPDGILADGHDILVPTIKERVLVSVNAHGSKVVAIVSHDMCAGNPVSKEEHLEHLHKAAETVRGWELPVEVVGLWVDGEKWEVERVF